MEKVIRATLSFEFFPESDHDWLFDGLSEEEMVNEARRMACDDIYNLANGNDVSRQLCIEIEQVEK